MAVFNEVLSPRNPSDAIYNEVITAGNGWLHEVKAGQALRIVDMGGNQAADTTFFSAANPEDHYDAIKTITNQRNIYLSTGTILYAQSGAPLLAIVADTCGRHDTLGGACSAQSNTIRYSRDIAYMHNCRDTFLLQIAKSDSGFEFEKGDIPPNINFFMNVPVTPDGHLQFDDGVSAPGYYVEMTALTDVIVLISNCPQLNNPCNAYNPTPIELLIWNE